MPSQSSEVGKSGQGAAAGGPYRAPDAALALQGDPAGLYLDLLKGCLTRGLFLHEQYREVDLGGYAARAWNLFRKRRGHEDWSIIESDEEAARRRAEGGKGWPRHGETMIGSSRLQTRSGA